MRFNIHKLDPRHWRAVRRIFDQFRQTYFSKEPRPAQFHVDATVEELRCILGREHFTNGWELSYSYEGEDLNMRRPEYRDDKYEWYQLHVRAFESDGGGVAVHAHYELEPTEHPSGHLDGTNFETDTGADMFAAILDEHGIAYERIES